MALARPKPTPSHDAAFIPRYFPLAGGMDGTKVVVSFEQNETTGPWPVIFEVKQSDCALPETMLFATGRDELAGIYQTYLRKGSKARMASILTWNSF